MSQPFDFDKVLKVLPDQSYSYHQTAHLLITEVAGDHADFYQRPDGGTLRR